MLYEVITAHSTASRPLEAVMTSNPKLFRLSLATIWLISLSSTNRITSYNVCYTKLLRSSNRHIQRIVRLFQAPFRKDFIDGRRTDPESYFDTGRRFGRIACRCSRIGHNLVHQIGKFGTGFFISHRIDVGNIIRRRVDLRFRITSYNVCYTKLLRFIIFCQTHLRYPQVKMQLIIVWK